MGFRSPLLKRLAALALAFAATACASGPNQPPATDVYDPWEGYNRQMFALNNAIDGAVLEPVAMGYRRVTTKAMRRSARNFLANLGTPVVFVNDILQFEFKRGGVTLGRFLMNSTLGLAGLMDPASEVGLERHGEDFGQTLAVWGVPPGPYLFVPLLGPSSLRDAPTMLIDAFFNPATYVGGAAATYYNVSTAGANAITLREQFQEPLVNLEENSLDFYTSYQSFFLQARRNAIFNGRIDVDSLPDFDEFDDFDDFDDLDDLDEPAAEAAPETTDDDGGAEDGGAGDQ
ncbi:MAG: VacJ family lipoprotein [Pseudomonadota bacterium]